MEVSGIDIFREIVEGTTLSPYFADVVADFFSLSYAYCRVPSGPWALQ